MHQRPSKECPSINKLLITHITRDADLEKNFFYMIDPHQIISLETYSIKDNKKQGMSQNESDTIDAHPKTNSYMSLWMI